MAETNGTHELETRKDVLFWFLPNKKKSQKVVSGFGLISQGKNTLFCFIKLLTLLGGGVKYFFMFIST